MKLGLNEKEISILQSHWHVVQSIKNHITDSLGPMKNQPILLVQLKIN